MHKLLLRQIKRSYGKDFDINSLDESTKLLLQNVSDTYEEAEKEKRFLENTIDLNSQELFNANKLIEEKNKNLQAINETLEDKVVEGVERNRKNELTLLEQSKMVAMGEMIGNIAHQWRQPLSAITSMSSAIKLHNEIGDLSSTQISETMDDILVKAHYLSETINTFRDFIKENKEIKEFVLEETIAKAVQIVMGALRDHHIQVIDKIDYSCLTKMVNRPSELSQVLINIFNNAKDIILEKQLEDGWVKLDLDITTQYAIITIEDNGGGIPENIMDKIFDPYFTTKHKSQGTGLGLHMSYKIITESMGGKIYATNSENGALFTIKLPLS